MTDDLTPDPTPEDKEAAEAPPEPAADANDLPDDAADGTVDDEESH